MLTYMKSLNKNPDSLKVLPQYSQQKLQPWLFGKLRAGSDRKRLTTEGFRV